MYLHVVYISFKTYNAGDSHHWHFSIETSSKLQMVMLEFSKVDTHSEIQLKDFAIHECGEEVGMYVFL